MATTVEHRGRKPGVPNKDRKHLQEIIDGCTSFEDIIETMSRKALGVTAVKVKEGTPFARKAVYLDAKGNPTGKEVWVYPAVPDARAAEFLVEQRYGRAPQSMDVTSGGEQMAGVFVVPAFNVPRKTTTGGQL